MSDYNMKAAENAGFRVFTGCKIDYANDDFARGYLNWGLHPPKEIENETTFALEKRSLPHRKSILDIGCGNGVSSIKMAELGYNVTALDLSPIFIDAGKKMEQERRTAGEVAGALERGVEERVEGTLERVEVLLLETDQALLAGENGFVDRRHLAFVGLGVGVGETGHLLGLVGFLGE